MGQSLTIKSLFSKSIETIDCSNLAARVMGGEVIIIPQCLQSIGCFQQLQSASFKGISQIVGQQRTQQIKQQGFENIHNHISLDELPEIVESAYRNHKIVSPMLAKALARQVLQVKRSFYYEESPNVRFHIPYDATVKKRQELNQFYWNGKVTAHGPHHDSWYCCPINSLNVWIAISPVKVGNGLTLYPQAYGKRLPCSEQGKILNNQYFGKSIEFNLNPGDVLLFHGEHLHGSEINSTHKTRHVVSFRMTLEKPKFLEKSPYQFDYAYLETGNRLSSTLRQTWINLRRSIEKQIDLWVNRAENRSYITSPITYKFNDTSSQFPSPLKAELNDAPDQQVLLFHDSDLIVGEIKPLTEKLCVVRSNKNQVTVFNRFCPHEGADLAGGYLKGTSVVCPWHNLPFDLSSGHSPCQSLPQISTTKFTRQKDSETWYSMDPENSGLKG